MDSTEKLIEVMDEKINQMGVLLRSDIREISHKIDAYAGQPQACMNAMRMRFVSRDVFHIVTTIIFFVFVVVFRIFALNQFIFNFKKLFLLSYAL